MNEFRIISSNRVFEDYHGYSRFIETDFSNDVDFKKYYGLFKDEVNKYTSYNGIDVPFVNVQVVKFDDCWQFDISMNEVQYYKEYEVESIY